VSTDQRTLMIDRVLNAISPALSAEIERMIDEKCADLEIQHHSRMQHAIREAEETIRRQAEIERHRVVEQVVEETRESVRKQVSDDLQAQFVQTLDATMRSLTSTHEAELQQATSTHAAELQQARAEWGAERDRIQQQLEQWRSFAEAQKQLFEANSQGEILVRWIKLAEPFGSSIALYTAKPDGLGLWKSRGTAVFPDVISHQTTDPEAFFMPIVVRGKTVAAISAVAPYQAEALGFLVNIMERALETFGLKLRSTIQKAPAPAPEPARIR
jgi:Rad3-related DNA helicase